MKDIPIIFSAPMVRALLEGRKTMTRRLAWRVVDYGETGAPDRPNDGRYGKESSPWQKVKPGDRLWVRENHYRTDDGDNEYAVYAADEQAVHEHLRTINRLPSDFRADVKARHLKLWPSIHMPRWASRLTLVVTATKIERLQKISNEDARIEGVDCWPDMAPRRDPFPAERFRDLWASLHGMESWDANPEVVALTFTVHKQNIDKGINNGQ